MSCRFESQVKSQKLKYFLFVFGWPLVIFSFECLLNLATHMHAEIKQLAFQKLLIRDRCKFYIPITSFLIFFVFYAIWNFKSVFLFCLCRFFRRANANKVSESRSNGSSISLIRDQKLNQSCKINQTNLIRRLPVHVAGQFATLKSYLLHEMRHDHNFTVLTRWYHLELVHSLSLSGESRVFSANDFPALTWLRV